MASNSYVAESVTAGSVLLYASAKLPQDVAFGRKPLLDGWVTDEGLKFANFNRAVEKAGWCCFFVPRETRANALGFSDERTLSRALRRLAAQAERERLNALEITTVQRGRFLGLHHARVTANLRHVQGSLILAPVSQRLLDGKAEKVTQVVQADGHKGYTEVVPS